MNKELVKLYFQLEKMISDNKLEEEQAINQIIEKLENRPQKSR